MIFALLPALQHFWVAISMVFTLAATFFALLKLTGNIVFLEYLPR